MDFVTNTATNPERSERRSTVTADETPPSHSEQSHERRLARMRVDGGNALNQKLRKRDKRA